MPIGARLLQKDIARSRRLTGAYEYERSGNSTVQEQAGFAGAKNHPTILNISIYLSDRSIGQTQRNFSTSARVPVRGYGQSRFDARPVVAGFRQQTGAIN